MTVSRYKREKSVSESLRDQLLELAKPAEPTAEIIEPSKPAVVASPAKVAPIEGAKAARPKMKISQSVRMKLHGMRNGRRALDPESRAAADALALFKAYEPPPGVLPSDKKATLAMDSGLQSWATDSYQQAWTMNNAYGYAFVEGVAFLGYAYLSELTQRPEYRRISERIATEMTRKWIKITTTEADDGEEDAEAKEEKEIRALLGTDGAMEDGPDPEEEPVEEDDDAGGPDQDDEDDDALSPEAEAAKARSKLLKKKVKEIEEDLKKFGIRDKFRKLAEHDGWFGRAHLYVDTGDGNKPDELVTDIGNGTDDASKGKFKKGALKGFKVVEPIWCYPIGYNANDPLADDWYNPQIWYAMAKQVHVSRLLTFIGREVPDILKPSYAFGGLSMSQMAKPYVDNWLRTRQAVTNLIESFSVSGVYTNAQALLQDGGDEVLDRIEVFNLTRSNLGTMVLDKDTEEFFNVSTPLGTLDHLQAQSQEQMSSVSGIPLIILLGITPSGLNASSEGEMRAFYDLIHAFQELLFRGHLTTVINFIQLNRYGTVDPEIGFDFEPLWSLDEKGQAEVDKIKAETHTINIDNGSISPEEVRGILIADPNLPYTGLDPNDVPEPPAEEGLLSGHGGKGGAGGFGGGDGPSDGSDGPSNDGHAQDQALDLEPIEIAEDVFAFDEWNEGLHKRDKDGKFSTTGGGGGGGEPPASAQGNKTFKTKKEHIAHLLTIGTTPKNLMEQMGWPSVSMPAQAQALGMKLEKKDGKYFGTPMTDAEKAEAKAAAAAKKAAKAAEKPAGPSSETLGKIAGELDKPEPAAKPEVKQEIDDEIEAYSKFTTQATLLANKNDAAGLKKLLADNPEQAEILKQHDKYTSDKVQKVIGAEPAKPAPAPEPAKPVSKPNILGPIAKAAIAESQQTKATAAELEKAKKAVPLKTSYVPGDKPPEGGAESKGADTLVKAFNDKWAGKENLSPAQLEEKVANFKALTAGVNGLAAVAKGKAAEAHKLAIEAAKKQAEQAAAKQAEQAAKLKEQHKAVRTELGIKEPAEIEAFDSFIEHFGGMEKALSQFKSWQNVAKKEAAANPGKGYENLSGFEMGCIKGYTGPKSGWINDAIINDSQTPAQYMFEQVLNSALDKLPKVKGKIVRRGLTMDAKTLAKMQAGKVWTHRNFASSNHEGWGGNVKLHIMTAGKNAAYVGDISSHVHENETLFKSNLRLLIDKTETKDGVMHVHCREL